MVIFSTVILLLWFLTFLMESKGDHKIVSVRPSRFCGLCNSTLPERFGPSHASIQPAWPVDVQRCGHCSVWPIWEFQIIAHTVTTVYDRWTDLNHLKFYQTVLALGCTTALAVGPLQELLLHTHIFADALTTQLLDRFLSAHILWNRLLP